MDRGLKLASLTAAALATGAIAQTASAAEAGDWIVRGGPTLIAPDSSSSNPTGVLSAGSEVDVENATSLGLTGTYFFSRSIALELLVSTPFSHDLEGSGGPIDEVSVGDTKHLPPTLTLQYHLDTGTPFRPYAGVGVNWTIFFDEDVDSETEAELANGADLDLDLDNSVGVTAQVGFDYELGNNWLVNADIRYIDIDTEADVTLNGQKAAGIDVDIDPWVYTLAVGYRF